MASRLGGWPLILGTFGLVMGLVIGMAILSIWGVDLFEGPRGPALGGVIGVLVGLYLER